MNSQETHVEMFMEKPPPNGVVLQVGIGINAQDMAHLECKCGAQFDWPIDRQDRWQPNRRFLNFCPGCGNPIVGLEIPVQHP